MITKRSLKYKHPKQVMLVLLKGGKRKSMVELCNRYKTKLPEYSDLIQQGIDLYDYYIVNEELNKLTQ